MQKTTNYKLPKWEKADRILMDDFNGLTGTLDTALHGVAVSAEAAQAAADSEAADRQAAVAAEATARESADTALGTRITNEATARANAVTAEATARENADAALRTAVDGKQAKLTGAATSIAANNLTASRALVSDANGKVAVSAVTAAELGYLDGVTSAIQTQLGSKQATLTGAATTIAASNLTASRALVSNASGKVAVSAVTATELGYLDGVTSAVQTQLNGKAASSHTHAQSAITGLTAALAAKGNCRIVTTSYTGNGKYGESNKNTLSYSGKPLLMLVFPPEYQGLLIASSLAAQGHFSREGSSYTMHMTWEDARVSWYFDGNNTNRADCQFNTNGKTYQCILLYSAG